MTERTIPSKDLASAPLTRSSKPTRVELQVVEPSAKIQPAEPQVDPRLRAQRAMLEGPLLTTILKFAWPPCW